MAQKSKAGIIGIILASLVVIIALIVLGCVLMHRHHGDNHDHDGALHSWMHSGMYETGESIVVEQGYARANGASAKAGAAFMVIKNFTDDDDRLIGASTNVAKKAALHSHTMDANGVMKMGPITDGLAIPAHSRIELKRGGNHVMMMGLTQSLNQGDVVTLTLKFENAGEISVDVPVDLNR